MRLKSIFPILLGLVMLFGAPDAYGAKTVRIKLTGSLYETMRVSLGQTGRSEIIQSLPYTFEVSKSDLPMRLKFDSDSYVYYDIDVPAKPFDTTGHVYLVKVNETAMALRNSNASNMVANTSTPVNNQRAAEPISGIDVTYGVNAAPITGIKNENSFALIIANENYEMAAHVDNATNDGLAFKEYCIKTLGIPPANLKYCENLSFGKMRKAFSDMLDLAGILNGEANLIIYYAGHGIPDNSSKDAFLMPTDADGTDTGICISLGDLYNKIENANLNRCVMFLDACFSGAQRGGDMIVAARGVKLKPKEAAPAGKTIVFSATSDDEAAYSHNNEAHGLFTYYLLAKLQETKGNINLGELSDYLSRTVALESRRINNNAQTPRTSVSPGLANSWKSIKLTK